MDNRYIKFLLSLVVAVLPFFSFSSCSEEDVQTYSSAGTAEPVVGVWQCVNTENKDGYAPSETIMTVWSSCHTTWKKPNGESVSGSIRMLGEEWIEVTYSGTAYKAEWWKDKSGTELNINVNGIRKGTPFPFDGKYKKIKDLNE